VRVEVEAGADEEKIIVSRHLIHFESKKKDGFARYTEEPEKSPEALSNLRLSIQIGFANST
jgi:hypothetical protein